ncbi:MAG: DNA polymerase IV [Lachnospiraceae bacterium]|nr:DNA polymerase IV [Lachnospiraceae bacterium]
MIIKRTIFHVDVNSAFLSWSAVDKLLKDPNAVDLRTIPSAVSGDPKSRHGIILAKSVPAKKYRVVTGEPTAAALRKCPELVLTAPDFQVYRRCSEAFIAILKKYAPVVEQVSVDEAFCDFTGTENLYGDLTAFAARLKNEIRDTLGFTVNVGISSNKLLAKMASDFEKPDKVHTLFPEEVPTKMWPLPIGELFGVGESTAEALRALKIMTIGDAARADEQVLCRRLGQKGGAYIHRAANGLDEGEVGQRTSHEQSYGNSTTLAENITAANANERLRPVMLALADSVGSRMRRDGRKGRTVAVTVRTADFANHARQKKLSDPTDMTDVIFETAVGLVREIWDGRKPIRLLGITVSSLDEEDMHQMSLFETPADEARREKMKKLDAMTDKIRKDFGRQAVTRGALMTDERLRRIGKKEE